MTHLKTFRNVGDECITNVAATLKVEEIDSDCIFSKVDFYQLLPSLKLTASLHLKIDGWNINFLLGVFSFSGALAVRFREETTIKGSIKRFNVILLLRFV